MGRSRRYKKLKKKVTVMELCWYDLKNDNRIKDRKINALRANIEDLEQTISMLKLDRLKMLHDIKENSERKLWL